MKIKMVAKSDVGKLRKVNEDYYGLFEEHNLAILCDGMGGHKGGAHASQLAVSTIRYMYTLLDQETHIEVAADLKDPYREIAAPLVSSIRLANRHIYNKAQKEKQLKGMGTTISALGFKENIAYICHVGDSRIYRFCHNQMELLTEDHSWINELIQDNEIKQEDAFQFEKKNIITRALGLAPSVKIDFRVEPIKTNDLFLLCSDGLTRGLTDEEIKHIVLSNQNDLHNAVNQLINSANLTDGSDNITVLLVQVLEKNSYEKTLLPISITLKPESDTISVVENRILKLKFSQKSLIDKIRNFSKSFRVNTYYTFYLFFLLLMFILFFKYNHDKNKDVVSEKIKAKVTSLKNFDQPKTLYKINYPHTKPDSLILINIDTASTIDSSILDSERIETKSLNKLSQNKGLIYLVGLENLLKEKNTKLFLNNRLCGNTNNFLETGIRIRPGKYKISIKDSNKTILFQHDPIWISAGEIKAIEFNPYKTNPDNR